VVLIRICPQRLVNIRFTVAGKTPASSRCPGQRSMEKNKIRRLVKPFTGLQAKACVTLAAVVVLAAVAVGNTVFKRARAALTTSAADHAIEVARVAAVACSGAFENNDRAFLIDFAEQLLLNPSVLYVAFLDARYEVVAAAQKPGTLVERIRDNRIEVDPAKPTRIVCLSDGRALLETIAPILCKDPSHKHAGIPHGLVLIGTDLQPVTSAISALARRTIELGSAAAIVAIVLGFVAMRRIVGPINRLARAAITLANKHEFHRIPVDRNDEIGSLTRAFNHMADRLLRTQRQLLRLNAELERRVAERTLELQARNEQLRRMAARDPLTGLYNRRHFNELLEKMFAEATRYGHELTCMMIDLDHFKQINDTFGHQAGDALLQQAADVIRTQLRRADVAARYGGDEFIVLLPHSNATEAFHSAKRIREAFKAMLERNWPSENMPAVSMSVGIADLHLSGATSASQLLRAADKALYKAKNMGKDSVCAAVTHDFALTGTKS